MFLPNWSLKGEYLYYDLGRATFGVGDIRRRLSAVAWSGLCGLQPHSFARTLDAIARVGINYHFTLAPPAPVVARY